MHAFAEAPPFIPFRRRAGIVAVAVALNSALYVAINNRQPADAHVVTASALDAALGLHAWTIWPYWLLLLLAPAMALAIRGRYLFAATMRAYVVALVLNVVLWLAIPTRLPRMPLPYGLDAATAGAWRLLLAVDAPGNCFPSGHVTLPLVIAAGFSLQYPRFAQATWLAIVALLPSVVSTGQHVAMDIAGGASTALIGLVVTRHPLLWRARCDVAATTDSGRASDLPGR